MIGNCDAGIAKSELSTLAPEMTKLPAPAAPLFESCTVLVEVEPFCTTPKSKGDGVMVKNGAATHLVHAPKSAFTAWAALKVRVHVPVPLQAPDQPLKKLPLVGLAIRVTTVQSLKLAAHCVGQLMPAGLLVIVPPPLRPLTLALRG